MANLLRPLRNRAASGYMPVVSPSIWVRKTLTFTGAAGLGLVGAVPLFNLTGRVKVDHIIPHCTVDLVSGGGGSLALGVTGLTSLFLGATVATTIDLGDWWVNTTPVAIAAAQIAAFKDILINASIIGTVSGFDITAGVIIFDVGYTPLTDDGALVAA